MDLNQFRQQYPQYSDMSDEDLADGIHRKFYPDMSREEVHKRLGVSKSYLPFKYEDKRTEQQASSDLSNMSIPEQMLSGVAAVPEAALNMTTGFAGMAASGLRQLTERAQGVSPEDAAKAGEESAKAITYQPRSTAGRVLTDTAGQVMETGKDIAGNILTNPSMPETEPFTRTLGETLFNLGTTVVPATKGLKGYKAERLAQETIKHDQMIKEAEQLQQKLEEGKQQEFQQNSQQGELFQNERVQPEGQTPYNLSPDKIAELEKELNPVVENRPGGQGELFDPTQARDEMLLREGGRGARDQLPKPDLELRDQPKLTEQEYFGPRESNLTEQRGITSEQPPIDYKPHLRGPEGDITEVGSNYHPSNFNPDLFAAMDRKMSVSDGFSPNGTRDLLNIVSQTSKVPYYRELAKLLLDDKDFNPRFKVVDELSHDWVGEYSGKDYGIKIHNKVQGQEHTFLHEAVHARTHAAYEMFKAGILHKSGYGHLYQPLKRLDTLYQSYKNLVKGKPAEESYGVTTGHEFIAEAFSNPVFQSELARTPLPRPLQTSTMRFYWDKFVENIGKVLGFDKNKLNYLSETIKTGADVMHGLDSRGRQIFNNSLDFLGTDQVHGTPIGNKFSDFKKELESKNIRIPEEAMRAIYKGSKPEISKLQGHPSEPVIKTINKIPGLDQIQQQYVDTRTIPEIREAVKNSKDITFAHANVVSKILHGKFTAIDHPILSWASSNIHALKNASIRSANELLHGDSRKNPSPGTYNYTWTKLKTNDRIDLNKVGQALNNSDIGITRDGIQSKAREILGHELTDRQLHAYQERITVNKKVLADVNQFLVSNKRPPIHELPQYWSPNQFQGPFLLRFKDTEGTTRKIVSSYLRPDVEKLQKQFGEYKLDVIEKGLRGEFDWDQFEWILRQLSQEMRDPASKAISEGLVRAGFSRHGLKRGGVEGGLGTEEGKTGLRKYEETSEKYIRGAYEYLSNRKLDRLYKTINEDMPELNNQPNAKGFALEAVDTARGGINESFEKIGTLLSEAVRGTIQISTLGKLQLPRQFLHDVIQYGNKIKTTLLLGFLLPTNILAQALQAPTYVLPKLFELGAKVGFDSAKTSTALTTAVLKSLHEYTKWDKSLDVQQLQKLGAFDATFRYDWSTYANKTDPHYRQTMADHLTGLSTLSWLESNAVRRPAALTFLHMLREIGYDKIAKTPEEIYTVAKEMTDHYMVSTKWYEKPQMFSRSGLIGTALSPLQSFSTTWFGMLREYMKMSGQGLTEGSLVKQLPLTSFLAVNLLTAGMLGIVGVKEWDAIANFMNKYMGFNIPTGTEYILSKVKSPKLAFGVLSDALGFNIGATFNAPTLTGSFAPGLQAIGAAGNLAYQGVKATGAFGELNKPTQVDMREALKGVAPRFSVIPGISQGDIEKSYSKLGMPEQTSKGVAGPYTRNDKDWQARHYGTYTLQEAKEKAVAYAAQRDTQNRTLRLSKAMNHMGDILLSSNNPSIHEMEPIIKALEADHFSGDDIKNGLKRELMSRMVESDVRAIGQGHGSKQAYIAQLLQQLR